LTQAFKTTQAIKTKGIVGSVLSLLLAFIVIIVGLFSIELSRYMLARDQLKSDLEAAVLCSQTTLASTGTPTNSSSQITAISSGLSLFQQNAILGQPLSNASLVSLAQGQSTPQFDVQPGETQICFQFLDPLTLLPTAQNGTVIQATGAYCYSPLCGKFIGLGSAQFTVQLAVNSGLPQLDVVFVYDVSGAENRQTPVTYAQRYWDTPYGIDYLLPSPIGDPPTQTITGGPQAPFCITNAPLQGPNPTTPQNLNNSQNCPSRQINYAEQSGSAIQQLTGAQGYAAPPGNYPYNGQINTVAIGSKNLNGTNYTCYYPCDNLASPNGFVLSLSDYIAVPAAELGVPRPFITAPYDNIPEQPTIVYISKASGFGSAKLSTYQAQYILNNNGPASHTELTTTLGGGSAYTAPGPFPVPSGPTVMGMTGNVTVPSASVLAGNTYDNYGHSFTDGVVNIDGNATFQGTSVTYNGNSFSFPSLGVVIEAARGNLENLGNAQAAGLNLQALGLTQANLQSGYYAAYVQAALASIQPMNTVASATIAFMNQLATVSDAHFGCLTFNDYVGSNASSTAPPSGTTAPDNIATDYPYSTMNSNPDGSVSPSITNTYLLPDILLDPSGNTTQSTIANVLPTIHTWGNCGVAGALQAALSELNPLSGSPSAGPNVARPNANKAIILVTTQAPNVGLNGDTGTLATSDAISMASLAHKAGIPIYCVAIAQSSTDDQNEDAAYNDNSGGIAATAGYGSKYYRVDWSNATTTQASLRSAFANIARRLTCVVH